eukprot:8728509-Pyramimonas_sp.AAC.1
MDECGVCDGDGSSCAKQVEVMLSVEEDADILLAGSAGYEAFVVGFGRQMGTLLGVDSNRIAVQGVTAAPARRARRSLLASSVDV